MLKREDFYGILESTLRNNASLIGIESFNGVTSVSKRDALFVIPQLNAIISRHPNKEVKDFLFTEYDVRGSLIRRLLVYLYTRLATCLVPLFAQRGVDIYFNNDIDINSILIYPCNKKIRIFDFNKGIVKTVLKDGFPSLYIEREISFRQSHLFSFVPRVLNAHLNQYYEETIIDGKPLARIQDPYTYSITVEKAYSLISSMTDESRIIRRDIQDYFSELRNRCIIYLQNKPGFSRFQDVNTIFYALGQDQHGLVPLFLSHGDLQQGNIWLTSSDEIIIIDWETAKERSPYYDYATLHHSLRMEHSKQKIYDNILIDEGVKDRFGICNSLFARIILAEELEYRVEDVISLPGSEGLDGFNDVLNQLLLMQY